MILYLIVGEVPGYCVDATPVHAQVLETRSVLAESVQVRQDPERSFVTIRSEQGVLLVESTGLEQIVRRIDEELAVYGRRPRKRL